MFVGTSGMSNSEGREVDILGESSRFQEVSTEKNEGRTGMVDMGTNSEEADVEVRTSHRLAAENIVQGG